MPSLVKGSGNSPASPTNGGYVRVIASIAGKSDQYPRRTLNSRYGSTRVWTVRKEVAYCGCACYEIHPKLKARRSSWRICRHAGHLFDLTGVIISSLNKKKNHCSAPLVDSLSRVAATHAYWPFFSLWCLSSKCSICESTFMLNFPNASGNSEEWCYANDVSYGIIVLLF